MTELKKILIALDGAEIEIVVRKRGPVMGAIFETPDGPKPEFTRAAHYMPSHNTQGGAAPINAPDDFWDDEDDGLGGRDAPDITPPSAPAPKPIPAPAARKPGRPRKTPVAAVLPKPNIPIWSLEPGARAMFPDENGVMFKGKVIRLEGASVFVNVQGEEWEVPADEVQEWPVTG